jgi:hypothetical protein
MNNQSEIEVNDYVIDFRNMTQYNKSDPNKQYQICRHIPNDSAETMCQSKGITSSIHRYSCRTRIDTDRFMAPPELHNKSFGDWSILQCPIVEKWIKQNPHYEFNSNDTIEQIASGIEKEGSQWKPDKDKTKEESQKEQDQAKEEFQKEQDQAKKDAKIFADRLRKMENKPLHEVMYCCVSLYTEPSFLYKLVNRVLREWGIRPKEDEKKVSTLGPYCCMLRNFLHEDNDKIFYTVYRGAILKPEHVKEYKKSKRQIKTWLGFSSTSQNKEVAKLFGNTLFVIEFKNDAAPCYPGRDISEESEFPHEEEVLLYPGVDFRIDDVKEINQGELKYIIDLSLV